MERLIRVASVADVAPEGVLLVDLDGIKIALCRRDGGFYAVGGACTHRNKPLTKGARGCLIDGAIQCVWHFAEFDPTTGRCLRAPQTPRDCMTLAPTLRTFPLTITGDDLFIDLGDSDLGEQEPTVRSEAGLSAVAAGA